MKSMWSDQDAERTVERYAQQEIGADIALRIYTSRLLGRDPHSCSMAAAMRP